MTPWLLTLDCFAAASFVDPHLHGKSAIVVARPEGKCGSCLPQIGEASHPFRACLRINLPAHRQDPEQGKNRHCGNQFLCGETTLTLLIGVHHSNGSSLHADRWRKSTATSERATATHRLSSAQVELAHCNLRESQLGINTPLKEGPVPATVAIRG